MPRRLVQLWSVRAKHAVLRRLPSSTLPQCASYFSDGTALGYRSWPPLWPREAVCALMKTCNQLHYSLLRTILDMYGLPPFGASETASPITDVCK